MGVGPFVARGETVWHGSVPVVMHDGGTALRLGFPLCTINHDICAPAEAARQIAAGLNLVQRLDGIEDAARQAERLIAAMSRHLPDMALPDYALLNEAPIRLRELIGWTQACRAQIAGLPAGQAA